MTEHDEFMTWDGAYVLGALSAADRRAFETHLATCDVCSAAVNELAALPGLLARVPADHAETLRPVDAGGELGGYLEGGGIGDGAKNRTGTASDSLPQLVRAARRHRTRVRWWTAGSVLAAAAVIAVVTALLLPAVLTPHLSEANGTHVTLTQVEPNPLSADVRLVSEPWGTRIETNCRYAQWAGSASGGPWTYTMVVTERSGASTQVSSWTASAGTTVSPTATTSVPVAEIASIDIRAANGQVLLKTSFD